MKTFGGIVLAFVFVLVLAVGGFYYWVSSDVKPTETDVALNIPEMTELNSTLEMAFGPNLISSMSWIVEHSEDKEFASIIKKIDGVKIKIYDYKGEPQEISETFEKNFVALNGNVWPKIVSVKEDNERILVFANAGDEFITGLCIFVVNADDAVLVNVSGELSAEEVDRVLASRR